MDIAGLSQSLLKGERRALARAITLCESTRGDHREAAEALLTGILGATGKASRIGLSGPPGVGKSTFIEAFGLYLIEQGLKVAVLAVDPSSQRSGGSILGDKTRMALLSQRPEAYIRPSAAGRTLGGVARRTRDTMLLCEAAGFDVILVETVGVGQSETAVADLVDSFMLILPPAGGDELQGIKRGVVELADIAVINKADGDLKAAAQRAASEYQSALRMLRPVTADWTPPVLQTSAKEARGFDGVWEAVGKHRAALGDAGLAKKRAAQAEAWFWRELQDGLVDVLLSDSGLRARLRGLEEEVKAGRLPPSQAAKRLLESFTADSEPPARGA